MSKIEIKQRYLDCVKEFRDNRIKTSTAEEAEKRIDRLNALRKKYSDIIPIDYKLRDHCLRFIDALENENYEICSEYKIV